MRRMDAGLNEASTALAHEFVALAATVEAVEAEATLGFIIFKKASHRPAPPPPLSRPQLSVLARSPAHLRSIIARGALQSRRRKHSQPTNPPSHRGVREAVHLLTK